MNPIVAIVGAWLGGDRSFVGAREGRGYCVGGSHGQCIASRRPPILAGVMIVTVSLFGANTGCDGARVMNSYSRLNFRVIGYFSRRLYEFLR